jgi:CheY-like chemotaxis protein
MPHRILLVEGQPIWQDLLSGDIMKAIPDAVVDIAPTVLDAAKLLITQKYDAIVMDDKLPKVRDTVNFERDLACVDSMDLPGLEQNAGAVLIKAIRKGNIRRADGTVLPILPENIAAPILFNSSAMDGQLAQMVKGLVTAFADKQQKEVVRFLNEQLLTPPSLPGLKL